MGLIITHFVLDKPVFFGYVYSVSPHIHFCLLTLRRDAMSNYERQIQATAKVYDEAMRAAEQEDIEILSSVVPGSRLHEIIHNPIDSGIDEG
jgi:hypothetical protein